MALPGRHLRLAAMARSSMRISSALSKFLERLASIHVAISRWCSSSSLLGVGAGREEFGRRVRCRWADQRVRARARAQVGIRLRVRVQESRRPSHRFELQGHAPLRYVKILSGSLLVRVYATRLRAWACVDRRPAFSAGVLAAPKPATTQARLSRPHPSPCPSPHPSPCPSPCSSPRPNPAPIASHSPARPPTLPPYPTSLARTLSSARRPSATS